MDAKAILLRAAEPGDIPAMHALDLLCFDERFRFDLEAMKHYALEPGAVVVVAESGCDLVGFVIIAREGSRGYISTLDVEPRARRSGVASRLLLEAEAKLSAAGVDTVDLHVFAENLAAIRFYEASGYRRLARERNYYGRGRDAWVYARKLPPPASH